MTRWHPRLELARLLEALSEDIIAATDEEVVQAHGRTVAGAAHEVRQLIDAARTDRESGALPCLGDQANGPRRARASRRPLPHQRH